MDVRVAAKVLLLACAFAAWSCGDGTGSGDDWGDSSPDEGWSEGGDVPDVPDAPDGADADGSDWTCSPTDPEICDGLDNDCDGLTDEDFDLENDPDNCGACGVPCFSLPHADAVCSEGACIIGACLAGYYDVNGGASDGCEYACEISTSSESRDNGTCEDGLDNDCDGRTDGTDPDCSSCVPELCDSLDNDCDGLTDEDFDTDFDPLNCGRCGAACGLHPHAEPLCVLGECDITCEEGWEDRNGDLLDGCEATCVPGPDPGETECDGTDDDCDGLTDEDYARDTCGTGLCERRSVCHRGTVLPCSPRTPPSGVDSSCDGVDEDCDGRTDDDFPGVGCGTGACSSRSSCVDGLEMPCTPGLPVGASDPTCDGVDDDCDGSTDEDYAPTRCGTGECVRDSTCVAGVPICTPGPAGVESCDGVDNDCDALTDERDAVGCGTMYADRDGDAYGDPADWRCLCGPTGEFTATVGGDCDDGAPGVNPAAVESCNGIDDDCDTSTDPQDSTGCADFWNDADRDGFGAGTPRCYCGPTGTYTASDATDCDDTNPARNPGAAETCVTSTDDDCDGVANERDAVSCTTFYRDVDGDTWGTSTSQCWCSPSGDFSATRSGDCDDSLPTINPGASEACNDVDDDCDTQTDEGFSCRIASTRACSVTVPTKTCNGTQTCSSSCNWQACVITDAEICNGIDDNCDGSLDPEGTTGCTNYFFDGDRDGYGVGAPRCYCGPTGSYTSTNALDCDDANPGRSPGVSETCVTPGDDDCDGVPNEQDAISCTRYYRDVDGDTWGISMNQCWCSPVGTYRATRSGDCNDSLPTINPGASEACNDVDDDCDTQTDEGFACRIGTTQACSVTVPTKTCSGTQTCSGSCSWGSCVIPQTGGYIETCNAIDDDCDGTVDDPPIPPSVLCTARPNATMACTAGSCVIGSCNGGWADTNGIVTDGCECAIESPEAPGTCGSATNLGSFSDAGAGSSTTVTGKITSASDVDCYSFSAPDSADTTADLYHVDIRFTANPSTQFQFTAYRGNCSTTVCSNETSTYAWYTDFTSGSMTTKTGENPCRTTNTYDYNLCNDSSTSYYFCVSRRTGFSPTCDQYTVGVSNGIY